MPIAIVPRQRRLAAGMALGLGVLGLHLWALGRWPVPAAAGRTVDAPPARSLRVQAVVVRSVPPAAMRDSFDAAPPVARPPPRQPRPRAAAVGSDPSPAPVTAALPRETSEAVAAAIDEPQPPAEPQAAGVDVPPVYATRAPAPTRLRYRLQIGDRRGEAVLDWQHDGKAYLLQLEAQEQGAPLLQQTSSGGFDAAGLAPERFVDRRRGRGAGAANFLRDSGRITFSGPRTEHPAWPGVQDRLGWIAQLAAIAAAAGRVPPRVSIFVVDGRGYGGLWTFEEAGSEAIDTPLGTVLATRVERAPQQLSDWRVQAWLDPQRDHWPVRLRMTVARSGAVFELNAIGPAGGR